MGPQVPIKAVIGSFHLTDPIGARTTAAASCGVEQIARSLGHLVQGSIFTGHCTGNHAYRILDAILGKRLQRIETGTIRNI